MESRSTIYRKDWDCRFSGHVVEIYNVGGSPDQELNPSKFVIHREIGKSRVPGICVFVIANIEIPMEGYTAVAIW